MDVNRELELLRESWTETFDQLFVLYEVAREVSSDLELDAVLDHIVNHAFLLLGVEAAAVLLFDAQTEELELRALKDGKSQRAKAGIRLKAGEGIAGEVAVSGKPIIVTHLLDEKLFRSDSRIFGNKIITPRNLICVPIFLRGGHIIGVIEVVNRNKGTFTLKDKDFLMAIANISALSIENAKVYKQLKDSEVYQAQMIENLPEGFIAVNISGKVTHKNSRAVKMLGIEGRAADSQEYTALLKSEPELLEHIKNALNNGKTQRCKEMSLAKTGKMIYLFTFVFRGNNNSVLGAGAVLQDIILERS
jgi:signal transduction protein with GAF and PtsI domain